MSVTYVSAELRRLVVARAEGLCEYCLIAEEWCTHLYKTQSQAISDFFSCTSIFDPLLYALV